MSSTSELIIFFTLLSDSPCRMTKYLLPDFFVFSFKYAMLPITSIFLQESQTQTGSGVPQYRSREIAQSFISRSHSPKRPSLICAGSQFISLFSAIIFSFTFLSDIRIYQESRA